MREQQQWRELRRRFLTKGANGVNVPVVSASSVTIDFGIDEPDVNYGVHVTPSWATTVRVTDKLKTGFTARFGSASGGSDTIDYIVFRE